ncbi:MAG TPA: PcfJ domain-containing protein [Myxococcota bacterium]
MSHHVKSSINGSTTQVLPVWVASGRGEPLRAAPDPALLRPAEVADDPEVMRLRDHLACMPRSVPGLEDAAWRGALEVLLDPIRAWDTQGGRLALVLGKFGFLLRRNRLHAGRSEWLPSGASFASGIEQLLFAFRRQSDLPAVAAALAQACAARNRTAPPRDTDWLAIARELRARGVLRALNRALRATLKLKLHALRLAATARTGFRDGVALDDAYALAAERGSVLSMIRRETPNLLSLVIHAHLAEAIPGVDRGSVGAVRQALLQRSIPPRIWRLLAKSNVSAVRHALRHQRARSPWEGFVTYCSYLADWGATQHVPGDLLRAAFSSQEPDEAGKVKFALVGPTDSQFLRLGIAEYWRRAPEKRTAFVGGEFLLVLNWVWDEHPGLDRLQRRAGWQRVLRAVRIWAAGQAVKAQHSGFAWSSPIRSLASDAHVAVALDSPHSLWKEGQALRHCVARYAMRCYEGTCLVYSIRSRAGKRVATAAIERCEDGGGWQLACVRGFANSRMEGPAAALARQIASTLNAEQSAPRRASPDAKQHEVCQ